MEKHQYKTSGTCSRTITFELDEEKRVHNVVFEGGCNGNLQGIGKLVEGMSAEEIVNRCSGIKCGFKPTSCPDQLSRALKEALK
ncbi:MAG: TIGR03905 family TSCPD domain-containing protein [Ruminococcaceae bacterium]|nr:TIGR03905 family TSCPD domain-containing protein [Oscillospiraceae bacterium]